MSPTPDQRRAELAAQVRAAFADSATPPAPPLVKTKKKDPYYRSVEERFRALIAEPTTIGLIERINEACHLTPAAERWCWRALLLAALDAPWDHPKDLQTTDLVHATTYWLRPDPCAYLDGHTDDEDAQTLRNRFSSAQRRVVAQYLGYVLTSELFVGTIYAYGTSQAISWCWRDDPETTAASDALRRAGRSYVRPPADNSLYEDLVQGIEFAFADTPRPEVLFGPGLTNEPCEYEVEFRGARWQELTPWLIDFHSAAYSFMTAEAFRYFLPAVLRHSILEGTEVQLDFHLVSKMLEPSSYRDKVRAMVGLFTREERLVILDFLMWDSGYTVDPGSDYDRAMTEIWDPDTGLSPVV